MKSDGICVKTPRIDTVDQSFYHMHMFFSFLVCGLQGWKGLLCQSCEEWEAQSLSQQGSQYQHVTCQHHCLDMHDRANVNTVQSREYSNRLAPDARHFHTTHASVDMPSRAFTNSKIMPVRVDLYLRAYLQNMNVYMSTAPIHSRTYTCSISEVGNLPQSVTLASVMQIGSITAPYSGFHPGVAWPCIPTLSRLPASRFRFANPFPFHKKFFTPRVTSQTGDNLFHGRSQPQVCGVDWGPRSSSIRN